MAFFISKWVHVQKVGLINEETGRWTVGLSVQRDIHALQQRTYCIGKLQIHFASPTEEKNVSTVVTVRKTGPKINLITGLLFTAYFSVSCSLMHVCT